MTERERERVGVDEFKRLISVIAGRSYLSLDVRAIGAVVGVAHLD